MNVFVQFQTYKMYLWSWLSYEDTCGFELRYTFWEQDTLAGIWDILLRECLGILCNKPSSMDEQSPH